MNGDNRAVVKRPITDAANPYATAFPGQNGSTLRGSSFVSMITFENTGTVSQTPVQVCDVLDVTTQRLTPFAANANVPADTYVVATTTGPTSDPITAPPYRPAATYNGTNNFAVDPSAYVVEYAAGDLGGGSPTEAPQPSTALQAAGCGDGDTATGWHTDPEDPAIAAYAQSLGLSDPFDVINRVRVTFTGGAIESGVALAIKVHSTTRSVYRDATTQAGQMIYATTRIGDIGAFEYPQSTVDPWTKTAYTGPVVAGRINVDTNVGITATPTTVQAGAPGQNRTTFTLTPTIAFGENVDTTQPLRVIHYLPVGMRYVNGSASRNPDHVLQQADGSTALVWDLGLVTGTTNQVTTLPNITFQGEADPLAPTPSINYSIGVSESVSATGEQIDQDMPTNGCVAPANHIRLNVPPTPTVPVSTVSLIPPPANYDGCASQGHPRRMDYQPITIGNAFLSLAALKTAFAPLVESGADDGVAGAEVGWDLTYANKTSNTFGGVDIVDVLPYPGDGRDPESDFSGTVDLSSISTTDSLSTTPNELPVSDTVFPPRSGTTFYVTSRPSAEVERDPYADSNLDGGETTWCLLDDVGEAGCPADLSDVTAVRIISGQLASQAQQTVRLGFATDGAEADDIMTNTAIARVIGVITPVEISGDAIQFAASSISGTIWEDADGDGVIGGAESVRLEGVTVTLAGTATTSGEAVNRTTQTAADGSYAFAGLPAGTYTVTVDQASARAVDPAYALTSDPDGITGPDGTFELNVPLGTDVAARDFGFASSSLAGTVFGDDDNDGVIDAGEDGIEGVTVTLTGTDDLGNPVSRTTTTDGDGAYSFADLRPGTYELDKTQPAATLSGRNVAGTAGGTGGAVGTNTITDIQLDAAENGVGYLFGELEPEILSGIVYVDANNDGTADAGEAGIPGVTITLTGTDSAGAVNRTTTTFADGTFTFADLRPGTYEIVEQQPAAYLQGTTSTSGSVGTVSGDTISEIEIGGAGETTGYAFGELTPSSLSGSVYEDLDGNGLRDAGEPGIADVEVNLSGAATPDPVVTDANGDFVVHGLPAGTYTVTAAEATGYLDAFETAGSAGGSVDNTSGSSHSISGVSLGVGVDAAGYLFGDVRPSSIAGAVYVDSDGNGARGETESGIGSVELTLSGTDLFGAAATGTVTTLPDGSYLIDGVLPGSYTVTETQPAGYFDGIDSAGSAGGTVGADSVSGIPLGSNEDVTGYLFGERVPASLSGIVFSDADADGVKDAGESGIPGVTITIRDGGDAVVGNVVTDASGAWTSGDLPPGTYSVTEESQPISGYIDGASVPGTAGGTAAPNTITGIAVDDAASGYLFAEIPLSIIRGAVWHDADDDGVADAGEAPIAGVTLTLSGAADRTTTTAADGSFLFAGLEAGTYTLTEEDLDDWADGATVVGSAGGSAAINTVSGIEIAPGTDASGYGFGERAAELQLVVDVQTLDAQLETGPYVGVGSPTRFTYTVVNNGDAVLGDVVVSDDVLGEVACPATEVGPHSSMDCTATTSAVAGQQRHTGTVDATVVPSASGSSGFGILAVTALQASDVAHYFGMVATATITATVDGEAATTAPGPVFENGHVRTVRLIVTNTGNVPLTLGSLDTGALGAVDCGTIDVVPVDGTVECTVKWTPQPGNYSFPITATLFGPDTTDVDGASGASTVSPSTTVFFQVLEPGVRPPAMAVTGTDVSWEAILAGALMLVVGSGILVIARLRQRRA